MYVDQRNGVMDRCNPPVTMPTGHLCSSAPSFNVNSSSLEHSIFLLLACSWLPVPQPGLGIEMGSLCPPCQAIYNIHNKDGEQTSGLYVSTGRIVFFN